jgi:hypothetical protein
LLQNSNRGYYKEDHIFGGEEDFGALVHGFGLDESHVALDSN